jgi:hypothetical protein
MSTMEVLVGITCLFLGYWAVSAFLDNKKDPPSAPPGSQGGPFQREVREDELPRSWHVILGVAETATLDEIRQAYRVRIGEYHPDKVAALGEELRELANRKSMEINAAYELAMKLRSG